MAAEMAAVSPLGRLLVRPARASEVHRDACSAVFAGHTLWLNRRAFETPTS
jgi:hypothetical protein